MVSHQWKKNYILDFINNIKEELIKLSEEIIEREVKLIIE